MAVVRPAVVMRGSFSRLGVRQHPGPRPAEAGGCRCQGGKSARVKPKRSIRAVSSTPPQTGSTGGPV